MNLNQWKDSGKYFNFKGNKIFYRIEGNGKPLLCVHGFPTSSWDWNPIWKELTAVYQVFTLDMIGFGFSDKPNNFPYSIHSQADVFESFLKENNITNPHILCHDYGVTVVQELLARNLDRQKANANGIEYRSACFLNGGLFPEMHKPRFIQKLLLSPIGFIISRLLTKEKFSKSFSEVFGPNTKPSAQELDEFWNLIQENNGHLLAHKHIGYMKERKIFRERWVGALENSKIPIRIINGPADPVSGIHLANYYKEKISNPDVILLPETIGHYPQVEDPSGVLKHYFEFRENIKS